MHLRPWLIVILALASLALGLGFGIALPHFSRARTGQSPFFSNFRPSELIENSAPAKVHVNQISVGMPRFTLDAATGRSDPVFTRHRAARAECTLAPAEQKEFVRALQGELEKALQASGAMITTRTNSGEGIQLDYTAAALTGCVHAWVVRGEADCVTVIISIHEDR